MEQANEKIPRASRKGGAGMTYGELITRLCKIRDDLTEAIGDGVTQTSELISRSYKLRDALTETVVQLKDAPVEWVKENPEGCSFCDGREPPEENENIYGTAIASSWCGKHLLIPSAASDGYRRCFINFCPMCGRDLRGT